jgi:hypothetical protein
MIFTDLNRNVGGPFYPLHRIENLELGVEIGGEKGVRPIRRGFGACRLEKGGVIWWKGGHFPF